MHARMRVHACDVACSTRPDVRVQASSEAWTLLAQGGVQKLLSWLHVDQREDV